MKFSGEKLRSIRKEKEMSREDVAFISGISVSTIKRIESGKKFSVKMAKKLASALNLWVDELLE